MERDYYFVDLCISCEVNVHGSHSDAETCHESTIAVTSLICDDELH